MEPSAVATALEAFIQQQGLSKPPTNGGGWTLGIHLVPVHWGGGKWLAKAYLQLTPQDGNEVAAKDAKAVAYVIAADSTAHWNQALINKVWDLLAARRVLSAPPVMSQSRWRSLHPPVGTEIVAFGVADINPMSTGKMPSAPEDDSQPSHPRITGAVMLEVVIDPKGHPIYAIGEEGKVPLLIAAAGWVTDWTFEPATIGGSVVSASFPIRLSFNAGTRRP
jgi:hypothetical protein